MSELDVVPKSRNRDNHKTPSIKKQLPRASQDTYHFINRCKDRRWVTYGHCSVVSGVGVNTV